MNAKSNFTPLMTTAQLAENLNRKDLVVLDASWHMPNSGRNGFAEYQNCHIENAQFFDIDAISDTKSQYPHMMPSEAKFEQLVGQMGISEKSKIVVYDSLGMFSAPRVWWMFRHMGHQRVAVLDGGLVKWKLEGRETTSAITNPTPQTFKAKRDPSLVKSFDQIMGNIETKAAQLIDARGAPRFFGSVPEPRAGLRSGHIKGSLNLPFSNLVNLDGTMKKDLEVEFKKIGVDIDEPIITTCGSGVTACILALALAKLGKFDVPIYDGSWSEWGAIENAPIE